MCISGLFPDSNLRIGVFLLVRLSMILHDSFGRQITDLRISVTDRCNFRCVYCRSADPENYRDHDEILSWPELDRLAKIFLGLGIRKIRVTGGEPLVRDGVEDYVSRLQALGFPDLSMTTNGHLLAERCDRLLAAGLRRINISLDSLDPAKFERITRTKSFSKVMDGIDAVQNSRIAPAKVNAVLVRGLNDDEIEAFAQFSRDRGVIMRFIEFMVAPTRRSCPRGVQPHPRALAPGSDSPRAQRNRSQIPLCRWRARRNRPHRLGHRALLWLLFANPGHARRQAPHLPVQ